MLPGIYCCYCNRVCTAMRTRHDEYSLASETDEYASGVGRED